MRKLVLIISLSLALSGCAATKLYGEYNPSNLSTSQLATISGVKKTFAQAFADQTSFKIIAVNGQPTPWTHNTYSKFEPGVHIIDWVYTDLVDMGFAMVEEILDQGSMVVQVESERKYIIGKRAENLSTVKVWDAENEDVVSISCEEQCNELKQKISQSFKKNDFLEQISN